VRGSSYVSVAYSEVRRLIISGDIPPGSRVTVRPLADRLDLSPTPIRTALAALERQGLLEVHEHRGYFVPTLGSEDMREIYEVREAVDSIASRRAAQAESRDDLVARLEELLDRQRRAVDRGDMEVYGELDAQFHKTIWRGSGNQRLVSVAENLLVQVRIGNTISARAPGRLPDALQEHAAIVEALRAGDARGAERETRNHVRRASKALTRIIED